MSVEETNKKAMRCEIEDIFNKGNLSLIDKIVAPNWVFSGPGGREAMGKEGYKQIVIGLRHAFPDLHMTIENMVAEGDMVALIYVMRGTFKGEYRGIAPTGKKMVMTSALFVRFKDGKEVEMKELYDLLEIFQQLGVSPPGS